MIPRTGAVYSERLTPMSGGTVRCRPWRTWRHGRPSTSGSTRSRGGAAPPCSAELRARGGVGPVRFFGMDAVAVTGYDDVREAFRDDVHLPGGATYRMHTEPVVGRTFISMDGKEHDRHRQLATPAFRSRAVARFDEDALLPLAHEVVDRFVDRGEGDLVAELTTVLPFYAITRKLGVPRASDDQMRVWADRMLTFPSDPDGAIAAAQRVLRGARSPARGTPARARRRPDLGAPRGRGRRAGARRRRGVLDDPAAVRGGRDDDVARDGQPAVGTPAPSGAARRGPRRSGAACRHRPRAAPVGAARRDAPPPRTRGRGRRR